MALILAVEPDPRQAAHIAAVLRARPRTELVIGESAVRALEMLADRVPDVLLTSPLLSRQDETALASWLRDLGTAATHVQELTIPILATSDPLPARKRGMLASLRRERPRDTTPDGCEPGMFAEQISVYAERASAGRKFEPPPPVDLILLPPCELDIAAMHAEPARELDFVDLLTRPLIFDHPDVAEVAAEAVVEVEAVRDVEAVQEVEAVPAVDAPPDDDPWIAIALEDVAEPPPPVPDDVWELSPITDADELFEIVMAPPPPRAVAPPPPRPPANTKRSARPKVTPAQDEWGFFDPEQCGFAALLAKLDEITEQADEPRDDGHDDAAETTVRVVSY